MTAPTIVYMPHSGVQHLADNPTLDGWATVVTRCGSHLVAPVELPEPVAQYATCRRCQEEES